MSDALSSHLKCPVRPVGEGGSVHVLWTFYFYLFSVLLGLYFMEQVAAQAISAGKMLF